MSEDATLDTVRSAAGALVAAGKLAEARAENVWAEAACALAVRARAPVDQLAGRDPARGASGPTRRTPPPSTLAVPFPSWADHDRGRALMHAYVRTGDWARVIGLGGAADTTEGGARMALVGTGGGDAVASTGGPAIGDGWAAWTLTLDTVLDDPAVREPVTP